MREPPDLERAPDIRCAHRPGFGSGPSVALIALVAAAAQPNPRPLDAQADGLRGYVLNVGAAVADGPLNDAAVSDFQRLRLMWSPDLGPFALELAYEHGVEARSAVGADGARLGLGAGRTSGDWLELQGELAASDHVRWRHRVDRAAVRVDLGSSVELTVGRQPISWATTLLLTPADPFSPFDPEDPFREYRAGVDALRVRTFLGPFTDVDVVVRPATFEAGTTITALGRFRTLLGGVELGAWAGALYDRPAGAASLTATFGGTAARAELVVREEDRTARLRFALGLHRGTTLLGSDLHVVLEYQRDGFGAASERELLSTIASAPAQRGELLALGRDTGALQLAWTVHPLWTVDLLTLANLGDPSLLIGPAVSRSLASESTLRAGLFWGLGDETAQPDALGSEYGIVPATGYLSLTWFF